MAFDLNALAGMDGAAEESTGGGGAGFEFPYMMWTYGDSKNAKKGGMNVGGFFIPIPTAEDRDSDEDKEKKAEAAALMAEHLPGAGRTTRSAGRNGIEDRLRPERNRSAEAYFITLLVLLCHKMRVSCKDERFNLVESEHGSRIGRGRD